MKAILVSAPGSVDALELRDVSAPVAGPGEVLIEVFASGVNFIDIYVREGRYAQEFPLIPGQEAAGIVVDLGPGVSGLAIGDRVAWCSVLGTYAEYAVAPASRVVKVPPDLSLTLAAASLLQGMTAHYLTRSLYSVAAGDRVLVHAGAGGVGLLLTQMAKQAGAHVTCTVSSEWKARIARHSGADDVLVYGDSSGQDIYRDLHGTMNVVYDSVGRSTFDASVRCLRDRGTVALYGTSSGKVDPYDLERLATGSYFVSRPILRHYTASTDELHWRASEVFAEIVSGRLEVAIGKIYPLEDARSAQADLESRISTGKLVLTSHHELSPAPYGKR